MRSPLAWIRRLSLRVRITLSFVVAALLLSAALCTATFLSVRAFLEHQQVRTTTRQTIFALTFARDFLATDRGGAQDLVRFLQTHANFDAMVTEGSSWYATSLSLTPNAVPSPLAAEVRAERVAYQQTVLGDSPLLVYGSPLPPPDTNLYLFYSVSGTDRTLSLILRVLIVSATAVVGLAALLAQPVARRLLQPLVAVSTAAQQVAEGLLETRVETTVHDEVGVLAASFNRMASAFQDMLMRERRFVAAVSHELRTPLATMRATSDVLASHVDRLPPDMREAVDLLAEDVVGMQTLVEELLEISQLESRRAPVRWEEADVRSIAEAVVRRRRLDVEVTGTSLRLAVDKARLDRILGNLVDNAFQHGGGQGVTITILHRDGRCEIVVSDRGPGIPEEDLPRVFERFYKADPVRPRSGGGIGLGLAIAEQNARLLGGSLLARNRAGGGAEFVLVLPIRQWPGEPP